MLPYEEAALEMKEQFGYILTEEKLDAWLAIRKEDSFSWLKKIVPEIQAEIKAQKGSSIPMWYLKFTPALKRAALKEGFPLFTGIGALGLAAKEVSSEEKK